MFPDSAQSGHAAALSAAPLAAPPSGTTEVHARHVLKHKPRGLGTWDYLGMLCGFLLTLAITFVNARGRIFWEDEMLGWLLLSDPSWHHMIRAWNLGADGGGFSFYLLGRAWFRLFGNSVLAFRMFSSTCFGLAFVATWAGLRRVFPLWIVAFATANSLFFSPPLTMHFLEGRFYGLLVMNTAFALWLTLVLDEAPEPTPRYLYLLAFLVHGLLTTSHLLGGVYSFFILCATMVLDRLRHRRRVALYLTVGASWLLLIPERTSIIAAGRVGKPHFWTKAPKAMDILNGYTGASPEIRAVLALLLCGAVLALIQAPGGFRAAMLQAFRRHRAIYVAAICMLLVPVWFLLEGLVGTWLFADRYLQPVSVGLAYVTAELLFLASGVSLVVSLRMRRPKLFAVGSGLLAVFFALLTFFWVFHHTAQATPEASDFTDELTDHLPANLPVVVEDGFTFTGLMGRKADAPVRYMYLLDWPFTISPSAPWLEVVQYHLMENWKNAGYFPDHIEDSSRFLRDNPRFLVVHTEPFAVDASKYNPEIGSFLAARLAARPDYQVHKLFTLDRLRRDQVTDTVWLVCRGDCGGTDEPLVREPEHCEISARGTECCRGDGCQLPPPPVPARFWQVGSWWNDGAQIKRLGSPVAAKPQR